jgi:hypothetical protein
MLLRSKEAVIAAIKQAYRERLVEQRGYRQAIKAAMVAKASQLEPLSAMPDAADIERLMSGECYPPTSEDWQIFKGYNWERIPSHQQLEQIEDKDIAFWLYMLKEVTDHMLRLKAVAKFFENFNAAEDAFNRAFSPWRQKSTLEIITLSC